MHAGTVRGKGWGCSSGVGGVRPPFDEHKALDEFISSCTLTNLLCSRYIVLAEEHTSSACCGISKQSQVILKKEGILLKDSVKRHKTNLRCNLGVFFHNHMLPKEGCFARNKVVWGVFQLQVCYFFRANTPLQNELYSDWVLLKIKY